MTEVFRGIDRAFVPGEILDINENTRHKLATLILDQTIELPPSNRGAARQYTKYSDEDFIELFRPLVDILKLEPGVGKLPLHYIERASRLGITPGSTTLYGRTTLSDIQRGLGLNSKDRYTKYTNKELLYEGKKLADYLDNRPTKYDIAQAASGGYPDVVEFFPTVYEVSRRFNKISTFHELIGRPSCRAWNREDYLDWSYAYYHQNPQTALSAQRINKLSARGLGPSESMIRIVFGSINNYKDLSSEQYELRSQTESLARESRIERIKNFAHKNELFSNFISRTIGKVESTRALQTYGQFMLSKTLLNSLDPDQYLELAAIESTDHFTETCIGLSENGLTVAKVETAALSLDVFDDLWPMYRFQDVNLTL